MNATVTMDLGDGNDMPTPVHRSELKAASVEGADDGEARLLWVRRNMGTLYIFCFILL